MVAEKIERPPAAAPAPSEVWTWSSSGGSGFEIAPATEEVATRVTRGTEIVLHLKKDAAKYLETYEIERIVRAYSDNIQFPIELVPEEGEPRQINSASALWQRPKSELSAEDYKQAYKSIAGAFDEPAMTLHYRAEGRQSYAVLLFAPSTKPFDLFEPDAQGQGKALCPPRLHRRRCRAAAGLLALHPRRDRQRGSAAQHLARDAAEQSAAGADPQGRDQPRHRLNSKASARRSRKRTQKSGTRSARSSRKASGKITSAARSCWRCRASPRRRAKNAR